MYITTSDWQCSDVIVFTIWFLIGCNPAVNVPFQVKKWHPPKQQQIEENGYKGMGRNAVTTLQYHFGENSCSAKLLTGGGFFLWWTQFLALFAAAHFHFIIFLFYSVMEKGIELDELPVSLPTQWQSPSTLAATKEQSTHLECRLKDEEFHCSLTT